MALSPAAALHLPHISPISPLYIPHISARRDGALARGGGGALRELLRLELGLRLREI